MITGQAAKVVLLVEDDEMVRVLIEEQLQELGYSVVTAITGDDAIKIVTTPCTIDLILTDVRMPGILNGFDLIEQALAFRPKIRTIAMSGYTGEIAARGFQPDRFFKKPFTLKFMAQELAALLAA